MVVYSNIGYSEITQIGPSGDVAKVRRIDPIFMELTGGELFVKIFPGDIFKIGDKVGLFECCQSKTYIIAGCVNKSHSLVKFSKEELDKVAEMRHRGSDISCFSVFS